MVEVGDPHNSSIIPNNALKNNELQDQQSFSKKIEERISPTWRFVIMTAMIFIVWMMHTIATVRIHTSTFSKSF